MHNLLTLRHRDELIYGAGSNTPSTTSSNVGSNLSLSCKGRAVRIDSCPSSLGLVKSRVSASLSAANCLLNHEMKRKERERAIFR